MVISKITGLVMSGILLATSGFMTVRAENMEEPVMMNTEVVTLYGDVNVDNSISINDAVQLNRHLAGLCELTNYANADVDVNYVVNTVDAMIILRFCVGSISSLPYYGN